LGEYGYMPVYRHCKHCWGDCGGGCLLPGDAGACIHRPYAVPFWQRVRSRKFWTITLWHGTHPR
jgi:hypothetical protein